MDMPNKTPFEVACTELREELDIHASDHPGIDGVSACACVCAEWAQRKVQGLVERIALMAMVVADVCTTAETRGSWHGGVQQSHALVLRPGESLPYDAG